MRRRKLRIIRIVITEILVMALGVVCCIMPMPWRLVVPILIGTRSILIKAHMRMKEPLPPEEIQTTPQKGNNENVKTKSKSKTENKAKTVNKEAGGKNAACQKDKQGNKNAA